MEDEKFGKVEWRKEFLGGCGGHGDERVKEKELSTRPWRERWEVKCRKKGRKRMKDGEETCSNAYG